MRSSKLTRRTWLALLLASALLPAARADQDQEPEIVEIRVAGTAAFPQAIDMQTEVYRPEGRGPFPVLIYSHGRAVSETARANLENPIGAGHVRYWLRKGFAIVVPIRPGYGETGGEDRESSGARFAKDGSCTRKPDFTRAIDQSVHAVLGALDWVRRQRWARKDAIVLEGTSVGGITSVAAAARNPPGVIAYINFAGGAGGNPEYAPGHSCDPQQLTGLYGQWGRTTRVPNLWLYARNDQYWGERMPREWHAAFAAGGSRSEFVHTEPLPGRDGHLLLGYGGKLWSVHTDRFIQQLKLD